MRFFWPVPFSTDASEAAMIGTSFRIVALLAKL
jgi:hypothetical protein